MQKHERWIDTCIVDDSNGNESKKYGPYEVAREAKSENTAASLHIGKLYFSSCRYLVMPISYILTGCFHNLADAYVCAAAGE